MRHFLQQIFLLSQEKAKMFYLLLTLVPREAVTDLNYSSIPEDRKFKSFEPSYFPLFVLKSIFLAIMLPKMYPLSVESDFQSGSFPLE